MILLDHCMPHRYLGLLHKWGYSANLLTDHAEADAPDAKVIEIATNLDAVLLTADLDFSNILDYPPKDYASIIVMRYQAHEETQADASLKSTLEDLYREDLRGTLVIVSPRQYRIRRSDD